MNYRMPLIWVSEKIQHIGNLPPLWNSCPAEPRLWLQPPGMSEKNEHIVFVILLCLPSAMLYESFHYKFQSKFPTALHILVMCNITFPSGESILVL